MPRDGRKPLSVHEVTWAAMRQIIDSDETDYQSYDDFIRAAVESANASLDLLDDELMKAVENGQMRLEQEVPEP